MARAEPEPGNSGVRGWAVPGQNHSAVRVAPLDPEQLQRVLEQVTRAQSSRAQRLRDAAQQATQQRGTGAGAPRLQRPQQLEAICVKVTSGDTKSKERPLPPRATIQPKPSGQSQLLGRGSSPQVLQVQVLGRTGSQLCFPRGSTQPPASQVLVQKPLPTLQPVSSRRVKAPQAAANGLGVSSARLFLSSLDTAHTEKLKKSLKVKTRSGRISRPPKYKARDYKFIKREDLADGHLSDSDDYSELSVDDDDEEEDREKPGLFDLKSCTLRPKAFKCQTCEKSYIGKGGLTRHLKLNPGHGHLEPEMLLSEKAESLTLGCVGSKTRSLAPSTVPIPAVLSTEEAESARCVLQSGQPVDVEETVVPEPERSPSALLGPEKHLEPGSGSRAGQGEFDTADTAGLPQSRAVQTNSDPAAPSGPSVSRRAQLREVLKQCEREELVELVLPELAQVVTLCELLVVKVERSPGAKPFFPAVYKEFEELYAVVKRMCQDYLSSSGLCSQEPLEINNDEVARSLGIPEFLRRKETHPSSVPECSSQEMEGKLEEGSRQKRQREQGAVVTGEGLVTVKKTRTAALPTDVPECPAAVSGRQRKPGSTCAPATSKGSAPTATESPSPCSEGSCEEMVPASDNSVPPVGQQLSVIASADFETRSGPADPTLLRQDASRSAFYPKVAEPRELPPAQLSVFSEENAPEHTVEHTGAVQRSSGVCGTPSSGREVEFLLLGASGNAAPEGLREMRQPHLRGQQASPSHAQPAEAASFPLQNILLVNVLPASCVSKTVPKPEPHPGPDGSLSTHGGPSVESKDGDVSWFLSRVEADDQRGPEPVAAVEESLAFGISDVCQEVLSQGQEQIFIQASNPSTIQVSEEENSVIVTNAGVLLRFGPSEGVALEALEAFHTVEAEFSQ